ncbi:MAG TPA: hypothetical protein VIB47_11425 [Dehalococcoidia bacterium]
MTNGRSSRGISLRDWSKVASTRAARWTRQVRPALGGVARRAARPTLRLFGAGRKPGAAMATALPRQEPLVLRMKRPERPIGTPFLTVQSDVTLDEDEAAVASTELVPEAPETSAASPAPTRAAPAQVLRQAERAVPVEEEPPEEPKPASVVGRISRAVQQVLRRPVPPATRPSAETSAAVPRTEAPPEAPATSSRSPQPEPDSRALRASAAADLAPTIARSAAPEEEEAPEQGMQAAEAEAGRPELTLRRQAEPPAAASYVEEAAEAAGPLEEPAEVESAAPPPALQRSPVPEAGQGLLMSLRRVFRPQTQPAQPADEKAPLPSPLESRAEQPAAPAMQPAVDTSAQAPSVARAIEPRMDEPPAEAPQASAPAEPVAEVSPTAARARAPSQEEDVPTEAPALQRSKAGETQPRESGLLFTLRRLVRPQPEREAEPRVERAIEAPAESAAQDISAVAAPPITSSESAALPSVPLAGREAGSPTLEASMEREDEAASVEEAALPGFRATESPDMALRRSRAVSDATERVEASSFDEVRPPATVQEPLAAAAAPDVPPVSRTTEGGGRLPRILRLWRKPMQPRQEDLNLTLARPAAAPAQSAAAASVQRSTFNVETGRTELMEARSDMPAAEAAAADVARASAAADAAPAVLRRTPRPSVSLQAGQPAQAPSRTQAPLVYRARQAESPLAGLAAGTTPGSMTTLEVSPAAVAQIRRATAQTNSTVIARAEGDAAPAPGEGSEEAPAPQGGGPATPPMAVEGEEETQVTLEALARQVYDRLRARLLIDRERAGIGAGMVGR